MSSFEQDAAALLADVQEELRQSLTERATGASDQDLNAVASVLRAMVRSDRADYGAELAGQIGRLVVDSWLLTSDLAERLLAFDQRLRPSSR